MKRIIHICALLMLSLLWDHQANAGWPVGDPWEKEEKKDQPDLAEKDEGSHVSNHAYSENQEEKE